MLRTHFSSPGAPSFFSSIFLLLLSFIASLMQSQLRHHAVRPHRSGETPSCLAYASRRGGLAPTPVCLQHGSGCRDPTYARDSPSSRSVPASNHRWRQRWCVNSLVAAAETQHTHTTLRVPDAFLLPTAVSETGNPPSAGRRCLPGSPLLCRMAPPESRL